MFNPFKTPLPSSQTSLRELEHISSSYPEGTPGRLFLDLTPKEVLILVRGARDAAQRFRTILLGFILASERTTDPVAFHETLPILLRVVRDDLDYEAFPAVELIEQAVALYADPKNANLSIVEVLTLAMQNLNGGKRHSPEGAAFAQGLVKPNSTPFPAQET